MDLHNANIALEVAASMVTIKRGDRLFRSVDEFRRAYRSKRVSTPNKKPNQPMYYLGSSNGVARFVRLEEPIAETFAEFDRRPMDYCFAYALIVEIPDSNANRSDQAYAVRILTKVVADGVKALPSDFIWRIITASKVAKGLGTTAEELSGLEH